MARFIRFIVRTDHASRTRCTGVVASLRILGEEGRLPDYHLEYADLEVGTLTTEKPGMIVYEDEFQIVAKSRSF